jgi:flagellar motor switch protein FliN/FliY
MTTQEALLSIAQSTAEAAADVLRQFAPGQVDFGEATVVLTGRDPLENVKVPAITAGVSYVDGVQGGNVIVMPVAAARSLAAAMGATPEEDSSAEMSEFELSAVGEAMNQMMAAAAASTGAVLGQEVEIDSPSVQVAETRADVKVSFQGATRATVAEIVVFGESCQLIQLIPTVFTMRMTQALESGAPGDYDAETADELRESLRLVPLRVWAELGRASLRSAEAAGLADGAIVELDRAADDPIDIFVNGSRIATGRLIALEEDEWAVRLEHVFPTAHTPEKGAA